MAWPQDGTWAALEDGMRLPVDGETWRLAVVDCGELALPSGRLVACGPIRVWGPPRRPVRAGLDIGAPSALG